MAILNTTTSGILLPGTGTSYNISSPSSFLQQQNFSLNFRTCLKWRLFSPDDFFIQDPNILVHKAGRMNLTFDVGDYKLIQRNKAVVCIPKALKPELAFVDYIYWSTRGISIFFLTLSIFVHVWVMRGYSERDTRAIVCHKISLLLFYGSMWVYLRRPTDWIFKIFSTLSAYGVQAAYCWINVISYDMWRSFHPKLMFSRLPTASRSFQHFVRQSLYAWGLPLVVISVSFLLSYLRLPRLTAWKRAGPAYGNIAQIPFMIACTALIVLANSVFCVLTIRNIQHNHQNSPLHNGATEAGNAMLRVYVKLVLVSGFLYLLDIGEWVHLHADFFSVYWLIPDWLSSAQGLWLFLIYCCNSSVIGALKAKVKQLRK